MSGTKESDPKHVWDVIKKVRTAMFVTHHDDTLDGRPLSAYPDEERGVI